LCVWTPIPLYAHRANFMGSPVGYRDKKRAPKLSLTRGKADGGINVSLPRVCERAARAASGGVAAWAAPMRGGQPAGSCVAWGDGMGKSLAFSQTTWLMCSPPARRIHFTNDRPSHPPRRLMAAASRGAWDGRCRSVAAICHDRADLSAFAGGPSVTMWTALCTRNIRNANMLILLALYRCASEVLRRRPSARSRLRLGG
jgi:hypothetical protein